jgi:hypothetical protein
VGALTGRLDLSVGDRDRRAGAIGEHAVGARAGGDRGLCAFGRARRVGGVDGVLSAPASRVADVGRALQDTAVRAIVRIVAITNGRWQVASGLCSARRSTAGHPSPNGHPRRGRTGLNFLGRDVDLVGQATRRFCESASRRPPPAGRPRRPHGQLRPQLTRAGCQRESSGLRLSGPTALKEVSHALPEPERSVPPLDSRAARSSAPRRPSPRCRRPPRVSPRGQRRPGSALRRPPPRHS